METSKVFFQPLVYKKRYVSDSLANIYARFRHFSEKIQLSLHEQKSKVKIRVNLTQGVLQKLFVSKSALKLSASP